MCSLATVGLGRGWIYHVLLHINNYFNKSNGKIEKKTLICLKRDVYFAVFSHKSHEERITYMTKFSFQPTKES